MRVGVHQADSTVENALSMATQFGLPFSEAQKEVSQISNIVSEWKRHFADCGVSPNDITNLAEHIDRPFLAEQRKLRY
jgi:serine/threonine-protein kinase HipA